jgi:hypothetical protein
MWSDDQKQAAWGAEGLLIYLLAFVLALILPLAASAATVATNGSPTGGSILVAGQTNSYTFAATAGERLQVRLAISSGTLVGKIALFNPSGTLVSSNYNATVASLINETAASSGTYTVVVSDNSANSQHGNTGTGVYNLFVTRGTQASPEATALTTGQPTAGTIDYGDLDTFTFTATAGERLQLRIVKTSGTTFVPRIDLYDPNGALVTSTYSATVGSLINDTASVSGTYLVVVSDYSGNSAHGNDSTGTYNLYVTRSTQASAEAVASTNGLPTAGTIDLGDLDILTFTATAGERLQLRIVKTSGSLFVPRIDLYAPNGALVTSTYNATVGSLINDTASVSGTYMVVVSDYSGNSAHGNDSTGTYNLYVTRSTQASAEAVASTNGQPTAGTIDLGDLDILTFTATAGERLQLRIVKTGGSLLVPRIDLYAPNGTLVTSTYSATVGSLINDTASVSGTYMVVVSDYSGNSAHGNDSTGTYNLYVTRSTQTSADAVALTNGQPTAGTIDLGDLDILTFTATAGERLQLRIVKTSGSLLVPRIDLYAPDGTLVSSTYDAAVGSLINDTASVSGTYMVVVSDYSGNSAHGNDSTGTYNLYVTRGAIAGGSEASVLKSQSVAGIIDLGDLDTFKVAATAGQTFQISLSTAAAGLVPRIDLYSPTGALVTSNYGTSSATVSATPAASGIFTAVVSDNSGNSAHGNTGTGAYTITATGAGDTGTAPSTGSDADTPLPFWVAWVFAGGLGMSVRRHLARKPGA